MAPLTSFIEKICLKVYLKNWLRYRYSKFQFCLLPSAIDILATVTTLGTFKHLDISNVSCKFQRNRPSSFWDTTLLSLYYLPKLHFGKYVTQSVCLYVCLFVCLWRCPTISQEQIVRSSPNLVHIWNLELRRDLLFLVLMTSLMTSSGPKVGQILKLPYLSQFLSYSVETKTEMQRWLWDIILLWFTSGVTSGASGSTLNFDIKMAAIFKIHVAY